MLVSVIVPVYNVEKYVEECLLSLTRQTYKNIEIICVDDGSTDKSGKILDTMSKVDDRLKVIHKENGGLSSARNAGIDAATGDIIMFVDSDDYLMPDTILRVVKQFNTIEDLDCCTFSITAYAEDDTVTQNIEGMNRYLELPYDTTLDFTFERALKTNIHVCNKAFKASLIKNNKFIEGLLYEDIYFMWLNFFRIKKMSYIKKDSYRYRIRSGSIMESTTKEKSIKSAIHHLANIEHLMNTLAKDKDTYDEHFGNILVLIDKYTRRAKEMAPEHTHCFIDVHRDTLRRHAALDSNLLRKSIESIYPDISIIVPVYNVEKYLESCLNSLIHQTYKNIEIICVDDGSTDKSGQILDDYASLDYRIKVIHKENGGLSSARNAGLKIARGAYIGFVDSDDFVELDCFEKAYNAMTSTDADLLMFSAKPFQDSFDTQQKVSQFSSWLKCQYEGLQELTWDKMKNTVGCVWNKFYKKSILDEHNHLFANGLLYEDISFTWYNFFITKKMYYLTDVLYHYRIRTGSIMDDAILANNFDKAAHHLYNWRYLMLKLLRDKELFLEHYEHLKSLLRRYTKDTKKMCSETEHHRVDILSSTYLMELEDIYKIMTL